ncbi:hypothetical protein AYO49_03825 [Verrucomicrobiaceae bacterium SCGC AG-212-N21]|nr:hypothetical protein AYO49_03825 [Verrucomicrobiaceae bacterium SCGC AG-212-N21]
MKFRASYVLQAVLVLACIVTWTWFSRTQRALEARRLAGADVPLLAARWKTTGPVELYLKDTSGTEHPFRSPSIGKNATFTTEMLQEVEEYMQTMQQLVMANETQGRPTGKPIGTLRGTASSTGKVEHLPVYRESNRQLAVQHAGKTYSATISEKSAFYIDKALQ